LADVHKITSERHDGHKGFRIDTPRLDRKVAHAGITIDETFSSARSRLMKKRPLDPSGPVADLRQ
jgi:hypothetical protein